VRADQRSEAQIRSRFLNHGQPEVIGSSVGLVSNAHVATDRLSGRRRRASALVSVRRPNCPYAFRVDSFHEGSERLSD
jgi:hypothetical protein